MVTNLVIANKSIILPEILEDPVLSLIAQYHTRDNYSGLDSLTAVQRS